MGNETGQPFEKMVQTKEGDIHFLDWGGKGEAIHFLHANGFCAGTYAPFVKNLLEDFHVTASDLRGHGDTRLPGPQRISHWGLFADDLVELIEKELVPPVVGLGHSLGAVATFLAAAKRPELFSGIILMDPVILPGKLLFFMKILRLFGQSGRIPLAKKARRRKKTFASRQEALKRFTSGRGIFKTWSPEFIHAYLECGLLEKDEHTALLKCDPEMEAMIYESVPDDIWKYARMIRCPVLALRGEKSDTFLKEASSRLQKTIPGCTVVSIPETGHFLPMEKPDLCARHIRDFIKSQG